MKGADVVYFTFEDSDTPLAGKLVDAHILDSLTAPIPDEHQDWELIEHRITHDEYLIFEGIAILRHQIHWIDNF